MTNMNLPGRQNNMVLCDGEDDVCVDLTPSFLGLRDLFLEIDFTLLDRDLGSWLVYFQLNLLLINKAK